VKVEDDGTHGDGEADEDHAEQEIFTNERQRVRGCRNDFNDERIVESLRNEDGCHQRRLFT